MLSSDELAINFAFAGIDTAAAAFGLIAVPVKQGLGVGLGAGVAVEEKTNVPAAGILVTIAATVGLAIGIAVAVGVGVGDGAVQPVGTLIAVAAALAVTSVLAKILPIVTELAPKVMAERLIRVPLKELFAPSVATFTTQNILHTLAPFNNVNAVPAVVPSAPSTLKM